MVEVHQSGQKARLAATVRVVLIAAICFCAYTPGCSNIARRGQSPDDEGMYFSENFEEPEYIGDLAAPAGLENLTVEGIGLVEELAGTGSEPPPSNQRDYLIDEIKTHDIGNAAELLASTSNAMVFVKGDIPPAARKGDRFDIIVQSPERTDTTSLEGGFLLSARLKPMLVTSRSVKTGQNLAIAEGRVLVARLFDSRDEAANLLAGVIPGGGVVTQDRQTGLALFEPAKSIQNSTRVARAINSRFTARVSGSPADVARPVTDRYIEILVPDSYRNNIGRYFHLLLNLALDEDANQRVNRLEVLTRQLHDPASSALAAIRLEAIGSEAIGVLNRGLRSEKPAVRFHSAEALAYLGDDSGAAALANFIESNAEYRWHGLAALAALRNQVSEAQLSTLFASESAETRYGAFATLRDSMPGSPFVDGEFVNREFMLHSVSSEGPAMVHFTRSVKPEITLFGPEQRFNERLQFAKRGITIRSIGQERIELIRYNPDAEPTRANCTNNVLDVLRTAAKLGCNYGDLLLLMKDASETGSTDTRLVIHAVPKLDRSYIVDDGSHLAGKAETTGRTASSKSSGETRGLFGKTR